MTALHGIRVLDFTRVLAGPHCGRMLSDLGADVIKIEPPDGDLTRYAKPRVNSLALYHVQQNIGKRNVSLDLRRREAVDLVLRLAGACDVVLENYRPGVMDRMGIGYEAMRARNPRIIFASISGYGSDGRWADRRAYARVIHAEMGMLHEASSRVAAGVPPDPFSHADLYAGIECAAGILAALYERERSGEGQRIEVAMAQALLYVNEWATGRVSGIEAGDEPDSLGTPGDSPIFTTREGHSITVSGDPLARGTFELYLKAIGRPELASDSRFATYADRRARGDELLGIIQDWVLGFDSLEEIERGLASAPLVMGVIRPVDESVATEWARDRGAMLQVPDRGGGTIAVPAPPWRFSRSAAGPRGEPAYRGEHNRVLLSELLGLSAGEIEALESSGVLSSRVPVKEEA